jgi:hypothetical protein
LLYLCSVANRDHDFTRVERSGTKAGEKFNLEFAVTH